VLENLLIIALVILSIIMISVILLQPDRSQGLAIVVAILFQIVR